MWKRRCKKICQSRDAPGSGLLVMTQNKRQNTNPLYNSFVDCSGLEIYETSRFVAAGLLVTISRKPTLHHYSKIRLEILTRKSNSKISHLDLPCFFSHRSCFRFVDDTLYCQRTFLIPCPNVSQQIKFLVRALWLVNLKYEAVLSPKSLEIYHQVFFTFTAIEKCKVFS